MTWGERVRLTFIMPQTLLGSLLQHCKLFSQHNCLLLRKQQPTTTTTKKGGNNCLQRYKTITSSFSCPSGSWPQRARHRHLNVYFVFCPWLRVRVRIRIRVRVRYNLRLCLCFCLRQFTLNLRGTFSFRPSLWAQHA